VIGESRVTFRGNSFQYFDNYGVAAAGQFARFSIGQHGQWYSGPAF
jgi:hypothetical protein